jgi:hypothetical protein
LSAVFQPIGHFWLFHNTKPERPTMQESPEALQPLRQQIETTLAIMNRVRSTATTIAHNVIVPAKYYHKLDIELADLEACARRLL